MAYLYLNFLDNLEKGSRSWDDFYTTSLTEQYEVIKRKLGAGVNESLQQFVLTAFPAENCSVYELTCRCDTFLHRGIIAVQAWKSILQNIK